MPSFSLNTGGGTSQNFQNFNGNFSYAAGTRQTTTSIAASIQGQSSVGARNILMVYQIGLRIAGGTYDAGSGPSPRPFSGYWRIWNSTTPTAAGASAASLSTSSLLSIAASASTTKAITTASVTNVILNGGVAYLFGFNNAPSGTFWAGISRETTSTQDVFQDTLTSTPTNDPFVLDTTVGLNVNPGTYSDTTTLMGTISYFTIPPAPVITSVTSLSNGVIIRFTVSETNSSTTTGCKAYFSLDNVSFTAVTGTFAGSAGSYTFTVTSASPTLGQSYYFRVCALNAVTTLDNTNNPTYDTRSLNSNAIQQTYGAANFIKVRNSTNTAWANASISVRTLIGGTLTWSGATIKKRSSTNTWLNNSVSGSITEVDLQPYSYTIKAMLSGDNATGYLWSKTGGTYTGTVTFSPSTTAQQVTVTGPTTGTLTTIVQCIISYNGGTFTATYTIFWGLV